MGSDLNNNLDVLFGKMENFISTKTVVGEPVHIGDIIMLPLVDVTFGVGSNSTDTKEGNKEKDSGFGGLGAKIVPSAVLVIKGGTVQLVNVKNQDSLNKLIDMAPSVLSKLNLGSMFSKNEDEKSSQEEKSSIILDDTSINEKF